MTHVQQGKLVILSGPSGAGKTTVVRDLLARCELPLVLSTSATTRPPRPGEEEAVDYHFLSREEFTRRREKGDFLECFQVFGKGHWYGSLRYEVTSSLAKGKWVILEIDTQGTLAVLEQYPDAITIFLRPRSMQELERRLRGRGTEQEETILERLEVARRELALAGRYEHQVINDSVEQAVQDICKLLTQSGE